MTPSLRINALLSLRAQIDLLIAIEESEQRQLEARTEQVGCIHPEDKRRDASTAGGPLRFLCLACNQEVMGVA